VAPPDPFDADLSVIRARRPLPDRPPGRDAAGGLVTSAGRPPQPESPLRSQEGSVDCSVHPDLDADLSVIHSSVDSLGPWLAIWEHQAEPDAHARRCASDAIGGIDAALGALHRIRARLVSETRQADDLTAERADALLARLREEAP
jgi:hypothetical protein